MFSFLSHEGFLFSMFALFLVSFYDFLYDFNFTFMDIPTLLSFCVLIVCIVWFSKSWFHYIWGIFTSIVVVVPVITNFFNHSNNVTAYLVDSIIFIFMISFYGYKIYKKFKGNATF